MSYKTASSKSYLLPLGLLFLAIVALLVAAVFILTPKIQNELVSQIKEELNKQSIPATISLSGRDVTLRGTVKSEEEKQSAEQITKKICGIRFVDNQLLTDKAENIALITNNSEKNTLVVKKLDQVTPDDSTKTEKTKNTAANSPLVSSPKESTSSETKSEVVKPNEATKPEKVTLVEKPEEVVKPEDVEKPGDVEKLAEATKPEKVAETKKSEEVEKEEVIKKTPEPTMPAMLTASAETKVETTQDSKPKRKTLDYDSMLAAMKAYQQQKGTSPKASSSTNNILFKQQTSELLPESQRELKQLVNNYKKSDKSIIEITVTAENSSFALERASAIRDYLVQQDIDKDRIRITGKSGQEAVSIKEVKTNKS